MNRKKTFQIILIISFFAVIAFMLLNKSYAVTPSEELYLKWNLQKSSMLSSFFRWLGWWIILMLRQIANSCEVLFNSAIDFMSFGISSMVSNFITETISPFIGVLLGVGIMFFGIGVMMLMNIERNKLVINFMLLLVSLVGLPLIMTQFTEISGMAVKMFAADSPSVSSSVVKDHVIDFKYVDDKNFVSDLDKTNNLTDNGVIVLNSMETIDPGDSQLKNKEVFNSETVINKNGGLEIKKADFGGWFGIGASHYYRYNYDFISIALTLLATIIVFVFMSYKGLRIGWELAFSRAFLLLVSPVDITVGAKTKKILIEIVTMYVVFICIGLSFRFFTMGINFLSHTFDNLLIRSILIFFLSLIVIDGPNLVEKVLGIDVGIKGGMSSVMSFLYGANTARNMVSNGIGMGHSMLSNLKNAMGNSFGKTASTASAANNVYSQNPNINDNNAVTDMAGDGNPSVNDVKSDNTGSPSDGIPFSGVVGNIDNGMPSFENMAAPPPSFADDQSTAASYDTENSDNNIPSYDDMAYANEYFDDQPYADAFNMGNDVNDMSYADYMADVPQEYFDGQSDADYNTGKENSNTNIQSFDGITDKSNHTDGQAYDADIDTPKSDGDKSTNKPFDNTGIFNDKSTSASDNIGGFDSKQASPAEIFNSKGSGVSSNDSPAKPNAAFNSASQDKGQANTISETGNKNVNKSADTYSKNSISTNTTSAAKPDTKEATTNKIYKSNNINKPENKNKFKKLNITKNKDRK